MHADAVAGVVENLIVGDRRTGDAPEIDPVGKVARGEVCHANVVDVLAGDGGGGGGGGGNAVVEIGIVVSIQREIGNLHIGLIAQVEHHIAGAADGDALQRRAALAGAEQGDVRLGVDRVGDVVDADGKIDGVTRLGGGDCRVDGRRVVGRTVGNRAVLRHVQRRRGRWPGRRQEQRAKRQTKQPAGDAPSLAAHRLVSAFDAPEPAIVRLSQFPLILAAAALRRLGPVRDKVQRLGGPEESRPNGRPKSKSPIAATLVLHNRQTLIFAADVPWCKGGSLLIGLFGPADLSRHTSIDLNRTAGRP